MSDLGACPEGFEPRVNLTTLEPSILSMATYYRCPCCGYRTLDSPCALSLCPVCWWEDDGQEDEDAGDVRLTVNGFLSLTQARMHYQQCGASHPRFVPYVRKPLADEG